MPTGRNRRRSGIDRSFAQLAERHRRNGNLELAVELCREGLAEYPDHLSGRVTLGWALLDLGEHEEARAELESVLKRAPDNLTAIRGLAELHDRSESSLLLDMHAPAGWPGADDTEGFDAAELARAAADDIDATDEIDETASLIDSLSTDGIGEASGAPTADAETPGPGLAAEAESPVASGRAEDTDDPAGPAPLADADDLQEVLARFEAAGSDEDASAFASAADEDVARDLSVDETAVDDQIYRFGHDEPRPEPEVAGAADGDTVEAEALDAAGLIESFQSAHALAASAVAAVDAPPVEDVESAEDAVPAGSDSDLSDAVAAFAAATEDRDEAPPAVFDTGEDGQVPEARPDELVASGLDAGDLLAGHAHAAALADDMAAYAETEPGPVEPPAQHAEPADLSSPLGSSEIAESGRHAGELVAGLSALAAYESSVAPDATVAGHPAVASGEDPDSTAADAPLADLDDPRLAVAGLPSVMEEAASFVAAPVDEAASEDTGFDLGADLSLVSAGAAPFEAYQAGAFDSAMEPEPVEAAFEGIHGAEDLVDAAADRDELAREIAVLTRFDDDRAADAAEPAAFAPSLDLAPEADWTPPLPSSPKPAPEPEPILSGFDLPLEFGPKAVARMQADDEPAHPAPIVEADEAADLVAKTPQIRLERMLRRVQARRLRRVVETVA